MKRERKYRALKQDGSMIYDVVPWDKDHVLDASCYYVVLDPTLYPEEGSVNIEVHKIPIKAIMDFTGLTDKNGKEIYEGDVVEFTSYGVTFKECVTWGDFWHETQMGDVHSGAGFEISNLSDSDQCEVIGNIHESPELLQP